MAVKVFETEEFGAVHISKRRGAKNVRLSVAADGTIKVSLPFWASYTSGLAYVREQSEWLRSHHKPQPRPIIQSMPVGKNHRVQFDMAPIDKPSTRITALEVRIIRPSGWAVTHPIVQKYAHRACVRALRSEAETFLPQRLRIIADKGGFSYSGVSIKQLKGRWGSCDARHAIVFNLYLMQLPWELIEYVILHELIHTRHLNHSQDFWQEFLRYEPRAMQLRARIKTYKPILLTDDNQPLVT